MQLIGCIYSQKKHPPGWAGACGKGEGLFFGVLLGVVFEEFLLNVGGDEFVAGEAHREGGAATSDGAQGGAVARHLF